MSTTGAIQQAMLGIRRAGDRVEGAAKGIANLPNDERLVEDVVTLSTSKNELRVNASVVRTAAEMEKDLLDVLA